MNIRPATAVDYPAIMAIWESAVSATHHFLDPAHFDLFKTLIPETFLPQLDVFAVDDEQGKMQAFFSVSADNLEMLFVDDAVRGNGIGKQVIAYVLDQLKVNKVDVNEQNSQAVGFYLKMGYQQIGRSEQDGMGKDYPLLHLQHRVRID
ncbi:MAG: GNAT family N-acetyltransferase [Sphingobacteriales bacterium]|nr:MAG: GNAT family N-acetyltransferase [Sphingobacteriales bacterium]